MPVAAAALRVTPPDPIVAVRTPVKVSMMVGEAITAVKVTSVTVVSIVVDVITSVVSIVISVVNTVLMMSVSVVVVVVIVSVVVVLLVEVLIVVVLRLATSLSRGAPLQRPWLDRLCYDGKVVDAVGFSHGPSDAPRT